MIHHLFDTNGDGMIDVHDCPYPLGSKEAKLWWKQVETYSKAHGHFNGKPLIPGPGPGQGDFDLLVNKLMVDRGLDHVSAVKIAGKVRHNLHGNR